MKKIVLTIAGSDSSGGAGIQADIKSIEANGSFAMSVITLITAQNSNEIRSIQQVDLKIIEEQIDVLFEDYEIEAVKIGALLNKEIISLVARKLKQYQAKKVVLDPVMISKSKSKLLNDNAARHMLNSFSEIANIITPNIPEAEILSGVSIKCVDDMVLAGEKILLYGYENVLVKGGHINDENMTDVLISNKGNKEFFHNKKINTKDTHGTGCTLSSAIASNWANNENIGDSVRKSIEYVQRGIKNSLRIGKGHGPLNHFVKGDKNETN